MRVSVITPTHNRPHLLEQAMESIRGQARILEVLVVDDGNVDLQPVLAPYHDLPVRILRAERPGQVPGRNWAIQAARGEIIALLDDDDRWLPGHLERLLLALEKADLAYADGLLEVIEHGSVIAQRGFGYAADSKLFERTNPILTSGTAYWRHLHEELGELDEQLPFYWDWDFYLRLLKTGKVLTRVPELGVVIRVQIDQPTEQGGNTTFQGNPEIPANLERFASKHGLSTLHQHSFLSALEDPEWQTYRARR